MQESVALLVPAIIALMVYMRLRGEVLPLSQMIIRYAAFVVSINALVYAITIYVFKNSNVRFEGVGFFKFLLAATGIAVVVAFVFKWFENVLEVRIEKTVEE